jgi:hypothetical protein
LEAQLDMAELAAIDPFLQDYGASLVLPCDLFVREECENTMLNVGDAMMISGNCLHNAPAFYEVPVVLFLAHVM